MSEAIHEASSIEILDGNGVSSDNNKTLAALLHPLEIQAPTIGMFT